MQTLWRKVNNHTNNNNQVVRYSNPNNEHNNNNNNNSNNQESTWSDDMISTHLPIYPVHCDKHRRFSIPKVLFDAISPSIDCVLLGECTHGTQQFYELRSLITKYLILYKGFTAIFIEVDWPKVWRLNQYVLGKLDDSKVTIDELFDDMKEYPLWMYRNNVIKDLVIWLKELNLKLKQNHKESQMVSFQGIDMQSYDSLKVLKGIYNRNKFILPNSLQIISFLEDINLNFYHSVERQYAENQVSKIYQLFLSTKHKIRNQHQYKDLIYNIDQNFMTLKAAIHYFNNDCLWDIRDNHWFDTMEKYFQYQSNGRYLGYQHADQQWEDMQDIKKGKLILWAHNSHCCNSDVTNYSHSNIGSMVKNRYGQRAVFTICFDSFCGSVTATNNRNERPRFYNLEKNVNESYGKLWHQLSHKWNEQNLMIFLKNGIDKMEDMELRINPKHYVSVKEVKKKRKIRDIGVCYMYSNPYNHCSNGNMLQLADVMIFVDKSNALEPFECDKHPNWNKNQRKWMVQNKPTQSNAS